MLLGREAERHEVDRVLATARSGRSAVLALVGEPGIGKTTLLDYAAGRADGLRLLRVRGIEAEAHVPFAGLSELLRPVLGFLERIPGPQAEALAGALALRPARRVERFAVGAATLSLLAACAEETPSLLLVDDAQALDESSAEALRFALRRLLADPLAALIATRDTEPSFVDASDLPTLRLGGLDREAAAALVGSVPQPLVDRLYDATAGNPLALLELAADADGIAAAPPEAPIPLSATISRAFLRRAASLDEDARTLLVLAAASGAQELATLERAARSLGLELAAIGAAETAGLVRLREGRVEFRHPLARAALYSEADPALLRAVHRALADALPDRDADRRAWHLGLSVVGTDDAASSALEQAGDRARDRSAYAVAAAAFERAATLAPAEDRRGRLLLAAADCAWIAGLAERCVDLLEQAHAIADGTLAQVDRLRGLIATRRGPVLEGHRILAAAAEQAADDPELAVPLLAEAVDACFFAGAVPQMLEASQRAVELLRPDASPRTEFLAATARGMALVFGGEGEQGIASFRRAAELGELAEVRSDTRLLPWLVMVPLWIRESGSGRELVDAAIETARARAALGVLPGVLSRVGRDHAAGDEWATAEVELDEAIRIARETGQGTELASALAGLAWLEARLGREESCRAHAAEARVLCAELGVGLYDTWAIRALGELELGLGRAAEAVAHFEEQAARLRELGITDVDLSPGAELVEAFLRLERPGDAAAAAREHEAQAWAKGQPWSLARAARCRGLLEDGDFGPHFDEALELHARTPDVFEAARTQLAYGARLRRARRRVDARARLRDALATFERLGAEPWSELARRELEATGETARRREDATRDLLTPQELQIARLLAGGRTTREAAAALFLSPKTIEYHLRHVYRKLGVNSRADLAAALGESTAAQPVRV